MTEDEGGRTVVRVHQLVKSLEGDILSDSEVLHVFTLKRGLISAMSLGDESDTGAQTSSTTVAAARVAAFPVKGFRGS